MNNKVLLYGFGPYAHYQHNVTGGIVNALTRRLPVNSHIFATKFSRIMFQTVLQDYQPEFIIGLGQDARAKKIRIERRAKNWRKGLITPGRPISKSSPEYRYASLKVKSDSSSTVTYDAGAYVCNYSMYLMCEYCEKTKAKFAFLHVPLKVDVDQCAKFIEGVIKNQCH